MDPQISIIIPSYNSTHTIHYTLEGLLNQKGGWLKEIFVIDSSDDGKIEEIKRKYTSPKIKYIKAGVRVIPAIGRNIGASKSTGTLLVFLDADVIPINDLLASIVAAYNKGYRAGCGSVTMAEFQTNIPVVVAQYYLQLSEYIPAGPERVKEFPAGCVVFCDKDIFGKTGGYPEIRAAEDVLLGQAINKITPLWFVPSVCVAHIFREDLDGYLNNQKLLGRYVAVYRKQNSNSLLMNGVMARILFPAFYLYKLSLVMIRVLRTDKDHILKFFSVLPLFLRGLLHWTIGFIQGCQKAEGEV